MAQPRHNETTLTCVLTLVRTGFDTDIDLEAGGQCAKQANTDSQPDEGRHATMGYSRSKLDNYATGIYSDLGRGNNSQLF